MKKIIALAFIGLVSAVLVGCDQNKSTAPDATATNAAPAAPSTNAPGK